MHSIMWLYIYTDFLIHHATTDILLDDDQEE